MKLQVQQLATQARSAQKSGDFAKAAALLERALSAEPDNPRLQRDRAGLLFAQRQFREAAHLLHELHVRLPEDREIWRDCATAYTQIGEFGLAEQFLKKCVGRDPNDYDSWKSLCYIAGSTMKHSDAMFYAIQALQLRPLEPSAHNNLGSILLAVGRYDDAMVSFDTVLKLQPGNLDALSNIATVLSMKGDSQRALDVYRECLKRAAPGSAFATTLKYRMSFDLFRLGELETGWECYDYGFAPLDLRSRSPKRRFEVPQWDGRTLEHETLLVWREQGLGDELMFLSVLDEVRARCADIIVECDARLIAPLSRSFPGIQVRSQAVKPTDMSSPYSDYDYHVPMGSLMRFFRPTLADFERSRGYIVPDTNRRDEFERRIKALPNRVKVGICWRSGKLNVERNSSYVPIAGLESLFRLPDVDFINLQYGECGEELRKVQEHFGVTIHQWPDIDLRDELDDVFTLISCLDHVVTAKTAVSEMAPAVGVPTTIFMPSRSWTLFGQDKYVFYPEVEVFLPEAGEDLSATIPRIADFLTQRHELR